MLTDLIDGTVKVYETQPEWLVTVRHISILLVIVLFGYGLYRYWDSLPERDPVYQDYKQSKKIGNYQVSIYQLLQQVDRQNQTHYCLLIFLPDDLGGKVSRRIEVSKKDFVYLSQLEKRATVDADYYIGSQGCYFSFPDFKHETVYELTGGNEGEA